MKTNRLICILGGIAVMALFAGIGAPTAKADGFFVGGGYHGGRGSHGGGGYYSGRGYYSGGSYYGGHGYSYRRTYYSRPCGYTVRYVLPAVVYRTYYPPPRVVYYAPAPRPSFGFSFGYGSSHHYRPHHASYYRPHYSRYSGHHRWR